MLRRDRDLFEDSLLTYASGLSPDSRSGAVRRPRPFRRRESEPVASLGRAASRFLSVVEFTVLTYSPMAAWLRGVRTRQRGAVSNWFIFDCSTDVLVVKMSELGFLGFRVGWTFRPLKRLGFRVGCWFGCGDGGVVVWLVGAPRRPGHTPLAALAPLSSHERCDCSLIV